MGINGKTHYLWRVVYHEGEVLEVYATKRRNRKAALDYNGLANHIGETS